MHSSKRFEVSGSAGLKVSMFPGLRQMYQAHSYEFNILKSDEIRIIPVTASFNIVPNLETLNLQTS